MVKKDDLIYEERLTSRRTEALFVALMLIFFLLFIWRMMAGGLSALVVVFLFLSAVFLFYSLNYRTLTIQLTAESLKLRFGIFTWTVPWDNVANYRLDDVPMLMRMGGAGIHFMSVRTRYRVSFNTAFLLIRNDVEMEVWYLLVVAPIAVVFYPTQQAGQPTV